MKLVLDIFSEFNTKRHRVMKNTNKAVTTFQMA